MNTTLFSDGGRRMTSLHASRRSLPEAGHSAVRFFHMLVSRRVRNPRQSVFGWPHGALDGCVHEGARYGTCAPRWRRRRRRSTTSRCLRAEATLRPDGVVGGLRRRRAAQCRRAVVFAHSRAWSRRAKQSKKTHRSATQAGAEALLSQNDDKQILSRRRRASCSKALRQTVAAPGTPASSRSRVRAVSANTSGSEHHTPYQTHDSCWARAGMARSCRTLARCESPSSDCIATVSAEPGWLSASGRTCV